MVDKSIPHRHIIMRMDNPQPQKVELPEGFYIDTYREGDEIAWGKMEQYAGDFNTWEKAVGYFRSTYLIEPEQLQKRFVMIRNAAGEGVCSCIAWNTFRNDQRCPALQWLVTAEGYEGLGLARAAAAETVNRYCAIGEKPVYLHTQPWSYKALWLYYKFGFRICREDTFQTFVNQCEEALPILKTLLPAEKQFVLQDLVD